MNEAEEACRAALNAHKYEAFVKTNTPAIFKIVVYLKCVECHDAIFIQGLKPELIDFKQFIIDNLNTMTFSDLRRHFLEYSNCNERKLNHLLK